MLSLLLLLPGAGGMTPPILALLRPMSLRLGGFWEA